MIGAYKLIRLARSLVALAISHKKPCNVVQKSSMQMRTASYAKRSLEGASANCGRRRSSSDLKHLKAQEELLELAPQAAFPYYFFLASRCSWRMRTPRP